MAGLMPLCQELELAEQLREPVASRREKNPAIKVFGVEPAASPILNGGDSRTTPTSRNWSKLYS